MEPSTQHYWIHEIVRNLGFAVAGTRKSKGREKTVELGPGRRSLVDSQMSPKLWAAKELTESLITWDTQLPKVEKTVHSSD